MVVPCSQSVTSTVIFRIPDKLYFFFPGVGVGGGGGINVNGYIQDFARVVHNS